MSKVTANRNGFTCEIIPSPFGQEYSLEFIRVTGELEHSSAYKVFRVKKEPIITADQKKIPNQEFVGSLNEKYFYPEKQLIIILSRGEMQAISEVMDKLFETSVIETKTNP